MKKTILLLSSAFLISMNVSAQTGTPAVKIFSNFNYDMSTEDGDLEDVFLRLTKK